VFFVNSSQTVAVGPSSPALRGFLTAIDCSRTVHVMLLHVIIAVTMRYLKHTEVIDVPYAPQ